MLRSIVVYLIWMFLIAFFMPLFAPTDVTLPGMEPILAPVVWFQVVAIYGLPLVFVLIDRRVEGKRQLETVRGNFSSSVKVRCANRLQCFAMGGGIIECNRNSTSLASFTAATAMFPVGRAKRTHGSP